MTEEIYYRQLDALSRNIKHGKINKVLEKLDELYEWKPVRLRWFLVRAEALSAMGQWEESHVMLRNRYDFTYEDPEAVSYLNWYKKWRKAENDSSGEELCSFLQDLIKDQGAEDSSLLQQANLKLQEAEVKWFEAPLQEGPCERLLEIYYTQSRFTEYIILEQFMKQNEIKYKEKYIFFENFLRNNWYLKEHVISQDPGFFHIVVDSEEQVTTAYVMAYILQTFGHQVYLFTEPVVYELDQEVSIEETVDITLENEEDMDGIHLLRSVKIISPQGERNNLSHVLSRLNKRYPDKTMTLISTSNRLDQLFTDPALNKCSNLVGGRAAYTHGNYFSFGYIGDYLDHLKELFHIDIRQEIEKKPSCRFSIVLPVRNSVETFKYTLQTCLNQRFQDYEIVVSDNSEEDRHEVSDLIKSLDNPKIKYYKTPCSCTLAKSFEFAYLKSNGEFLLSLGADDAILPWGLETLDKLLNGFPEEELFCWDRGFYIWPNYSNPCQLGQFNIPRNYKKDELNAERWSSIDSLNRVLESPGSIYVEPLLYINSGFRRSFLKTFLKNTGGLWAGDAQDVYTGIAALCIKESVIHLYYPITIAGMSGSSIGAFYSPGNQGSKVKGLYDGYYDSCIIYPHMEKEHWAFMPGNEFSTVLREMLRAGSKGILPDEVKDKLKLSYIIEQTALKEFKQSIFYEHNVLTLKHISKGLPPEERLRLEKDLFSCYLKPEILVMPSEDTLIYKQGFNNGGGLVLDSRKFNVENVAEAVTLFENITNL